MSSRRVQSHINKYTITCTILSSMTLILVGLDSSNVTSAAVTRFLGDDESLVHVIIFVVLCPIASLAAGSASDWAGRRYTLSLSLVAFFAGFLTTSLARNYVVFVLGRVLVSVGIGCAQTVAPLYVVELSPDSTRGFLTSFVDAFVIAGKLIGDISVYLCSDKLRDDLSWRVELGIGAIPSVLLALCVISLPESPSWLVSRGRLGDAKRVLDKTSDSASSAESRLADLKSAFGISLESQDDVAWRPKPRSFWRSLRDLVFRPSPSVRWALIAAVGLNFFRQASGVSAVELFRPVILEGAGIVNKRELLLATTAVRLISIGLVLTVGSLMDRIGRRPLLLAGVAGMIPSIAGLGLAMKACYHSKDKRIWAVAVAMGLSFEAFYSIGLGPVTWVYSLEIFPGFLRVHGASLASGIQWVTRGVVSMATLSVSMAITIGGTFLVFAGVASLAWLYILKLVPETLENCCEKRTGLEDHAAESESQINEDLERVTPDENMMDRVLQKSFTFPVCRNSAPSISFFPFRARESN